MNQIKLHYKIAKLFLEEPGGQNPQEVRILKEANPDSENYFFAVANAEWLDWLWKNGFLDDIKKKADDTKQYSYRMPELHYLTKMVDKDPGKVAEIILSVETSKDTFNPEVIDQFSRICGDLPAEHLAKVIPKIKEDNWVVLMGVFNHLDFEFKAMFNTLAEAKDFESVVTLAEVALSVKSKTEIIKEGKQVGFDSPFYFNHLTETDVFNSLLSVSDEYVENASDTALQVLADIVNLGKKSNGRTSFKVEDIFYLSDLDFFSVEPGRKHSTYRESVEELAAVIKNLAVRLIGLNNDDEKKLSDIYDEKIHPLPDSQLIWRLRLFILSLAPQKYSEIIEEALERIFEAKHYHDIISGAEYFKLLQSSFDSLSKKYQEDYTQRIILHFCKVMEKSDDERKKWDQIYGSRILSTIADYISYDVKKEAEKAGFKLDIDFEPKPSIGSVEGGFVQEVSPVTQDELDELSIEKIVEKLTSEWSPETLAEKYKTDSFLSPRNAEGLGNAIKENIKNRIPEYVENAPLFFDQEKLNAHYTYSYLNGIKDAIKENPGSSLKTVWGPFFELFNNIIDTCKKEGLRDCKGSFSPNRTWLAGWRAVHSAMVDVLKELLTDVGGKAVIDFDEYRSEVFKMLEYLLSYPDPDFADEKIETAKITTKSPGEDTYVSDPFTIAINSVRGRAFETFVLFVYQDGKKLDKDSTIKISEDCKKLYASILEKENTRAIMFLFGHNLPSFYYRDKDWLKSLLPEIFSDENDKRLLCSAAWEGYLSNNLYQEIFFDEDFQSLYERGLELVNDESIKQKHFVELDEGLATHLALAFIHYGEFSFDSALFKKFLDKGSEKQIAKFISFIGRSVINGDNAKLDEFVHKDNEVKQKLVKLWDWVLENKDDVEIFEDFGLWINTDKNLFEIGWLIDHVEKTLNKSQGILEWELGLRKSIVKFAETSPKNTIKIVKLFLLDSWERRKQSNVYYHVDKEWLDTFTVLYDNPETKDETYKLINDLILKGGSIFWALEEIVNSSGSEGPSR